MFLKKTTESRTNLKKERKTKMSVRIGFILGAEIVVLLSMLVAVSLIFVSRELERSFTDTTNELLDSTIQGLAYRNSKFMQQLRMYTVSDAAKTPGFTTEDLVNWLVAHEKARSGDFESVLYCDYETNLGYFDDGKVIDVSNLDFYKNMKSGDLKQYISHPYGTSAEDSVYYVCKSITRNKKRIGFFAASVGHATLMKAINAIKLGENGYAILIDNDGEVMAYPPDDSIVMRANFKNADSLGLGFTGLNTLVEDVCKGNRGAGWVTGENKNLVVYGPVQGTPWGILFVIPKSQVYATAVNLQHILVISVIIITLVLIITAQFSIYMSLRPLGKVEKRIIDISSGTADLTKRIPVLTRDEVGMLTGGFNKFVEKLQNIMMDIKASRIELDESEGTLHLGLEDTASAITEILDNVKQVHGQLGSQVACVDETSSAVNQISSNIGSLEKMIETQSAGVTQASASVEEMIGNIGSVNKSVAKMASSFEVLEEHVKAGNEQQSEVNERISQIEAQSEMLLEANEAIASIASQTNLLAMNAAIEAAHAGDAGKGFSVVADEIRKLSETSAEQSRTIGEQLAKIKESIGSVVTVSASTIETFGNVTSSIKETDQLVRQIKSAMEEQQEGSRQISLALHEMSDSTAEVRQASSEMSSGNEAILEEVRRLKDSTGNMEDSVNLMTTNAEKISSIKYMLESIVEQMKASISKIGSQIDNFKV
ncbi:MAG: HAMP domain-containing protein [Treponema sp.]|nr:HAMP domain-containing protein [Treponema sp.]